MERVFTQDIGRYKKGERRDYPERTWRQFFGDYEKITRAVDDAVVSNKRKDT